MSEKIELRGRPEGSLKSDPKDYKTRFHKFYYKNRNELLESNRQRYAERKKNKQCVVCGANDLAPGNKLFCKKHVRTQKKVKK